MVLGFFLFGTLAIFESSAQETFKVMFYNLLNYPLEEAVPNREADFNVILSDYQPDVLMVCELNTEIGATNVRSLAQFAISPDYEMATYVTNTSDDQSSDENRLQNLIYFDSTKFTLQDEVIVATTLRDFNIYKLRLNTTEQASNPIDIYFIVCHLKASSGPLNAQRRFEMILELEVYLNTLPEDANVVLGGDLNVYTASEPAFLELIDTNNWISFVDPAARIGSWNNNPFFVDVFTQSTRAATGFGGSRGGFDDRFDFILTSSNMMSSAPITYVPESYKVYGNNGLSSCYNRAINSPNCGTVNSEFSFAVRDALHNFSDHLPVTLVLETEATLLSTDEATPIETTILEKRLVKNKLELRLHTTGLKNKALVIYNSLGQRVQQLSTGVDDYQTIDISNLVNGTYVLWINSDQYQPIKFIVAK